MSVHDAHCIHATPFAGAEACDCGRAHGTQHLLTRGLKTRVDPDQPPPAFGLLSCRMWVSGSTSLGEGAQRHVHPRVRRGTQEGFPMVECVDVERRQPRDRLAGEAWADSPAGHRS